MIANDCMALFNFQVGLMCCGADDRVFGRRLTRQSISSVALILRLAGSLDNIKASNFVIQFFLWSSVTHVEIKYYNQEEELEKSNM